MFNVGDGATEGQRCEINSIGKWNSAVRQPVYILAFNSPNPDPFWQVYKLPSQGFFGDVEFTNANAVDGAILEANYVAAGGYGKYKLTFSTKTIDSPPQPNGGFMDYFSNYGPVWHTYDLKPQISAPGGNILSTFPLGTLGGYAILSGTSMATPYVSGIYALIKSQYPKASIQEIRNLIQTTATPLSWIYDNSIVSATAHQGAGQINAYNAVTSRSIISPGQILASDVTHTKYGIAKVTIKNSSPNPQTYILSHVGAGYTDYRLQYREDTQVPIYGNATFDKSQVTIRSGQSATVSVHINPPNEVYPDRLPVFGGFISVASAEGKYSIPYLGPPYSLYNAAYLHISSDPVIPGLWTRNATDDSIIYPKGFLEVDPALSYFASFPTDQWTTELRVDVLPANTKITANHYGFDTSDIVPSYQASAVTPTSSVFGFSSFGTLIRQKASSWNWPAGNSNSYKDTLVTTDDGFKIAVGNGDYRFFASVLRQGGKSGVQADYDTYLSPIVRFINA